tara:strand:+ start:1103 stop:1588 length:486 start_codon:yes stop_codon:yes gene_type:complete
MKDLLLKKLHKYSLLLILGYLFCQGDFLAAQQKEIHSLPIKKEIVKADKSTKDLIPMPSGDINTSSNKVNYNRNPFQESLRNEFPTIENLYSSLKFRGLAKSENKLFAIIETNSNQKFYKVGDSLDNGFVVQFISIEDVTVDISNGDKKYRLSLVDIEKLI